MGEQDVLLELTDVTKRFDSPGGGPGRTVLNEVNLRLGAGRSLAICGPSGSGKSTLLNIIAALDAPTAGHVTLDGQDLAALNDKALAAVRARSIGMVFQLHHLLPQCTVLENVLVPTMVCPPPDGEAPEARAERLLERVGLADHLSHRPGQLSGGERQRVAVVRALINRPHLLLADEPTGALDRRAADNLADLLVELNTEEDVALIVATHAPDLAARMQRVGELRDGTLREAPNAR